MVDPLFWLGLSILLVAVSITAVLMAALPAFKELSRAARSAEKLFDTLNRELPPTLEAIRLTSLEITELTDDMTEGVQNVGRMTQQVDQGVSGVKQQAKQAQITTRSVVAGFKAAMSAFARPSSRRPTPVPTRPRLPSSQTEEVQGVEDIEEIAAEFDELETEFVSPSVVSSESSAAHTEKIRIEKERLPIDSDEALEDSLEESIDLPEAHHAELPHNGKHQQPQLRPSSSPQLNISPSASPETPPLSIERERERQS